MYKLACILLAAVLAAPASATINSTSKESTSKAVEAGSSFFEQKKRIEEALGDGKSYSEIKAADRDQVVAALQRISAALTKAGTVEALGAKEKADVFNDQELVNNLLTQAGEDSRLVCSRGKKVGSHRVTTRCTTVAQRRRDAEESQKALRDNQGIKLPPPG